MKLYPFLKITTKPKMLPTLIENQTHDHETHNIESYWYLNAPFVLGEDRISCIQQRSMINMTMKWDELMHIVDTQGGEFNWKFGKNCGSQCGTFNLMCFIDFKGKKNRLIHSYLTLAFYNKDGKRVKTTAEFYDDSEMVKTFCRFLVEYTRSIVGEPSYRMPCCSCEGYRNMQTREFLNIENTLRIMKNAKARGVGFRCDCGTTEKMMNNPLKSDDELQAEYSTLPTFNQVFEKLI